MKKIISFSFVLLLMAFSFIGCEKQLEEKPKSLLSPDNFYKSDGDFNQSINGGLLSLWVFFNNATPYVMLGGSDDISSKSDAPQAKIYDVFLATPTDSYTRTTWSNFYSTINICNPIINNVKNATAVSDNNKKIYEGQARYMRALSYFWLTRLYGEVPIILTREDQLNTAKIGQSPVADIYKIIVEDLTIAKDYLPTSFPEIGKPTKGAAGSLLASVYLTMAGWPLKDASKYALARDAAKEVMDLNVYKLEPNYIDLWVVSKAKTSKEIIFALWGNSATSVAASHRHMSMRPGEEGGYQSYFSEARFFNAFPAGPRKDGSFHTVFTDAAHTTWQKSRIGQPFILKYRDGGDAATMFGPVLIIPVGSGNWVNTRYSEVLLTYAEAANMAENGPSTAATDAINLVRRRAGGNNQSVYADLPYGMTKAAFDTEVIKERAWELAFEGIRWFDLVRKEMVVSVNIGLYPYVTPNHMLIPKPQTEIDITEGLKQNTGY
jgi:starch-binding outer membrane protein, SusD/RagB family